MIIAWTISNALLDAGRDSYYHESRVLGRGRHPSNRKRKGQRAKMAAAYAEYRHGLSVNLIAYRKEVMYNIT